MEEYDNIDVSIEVLKSLLKQRGYDYEYFPDDHSVVFIDGMGTVRECWPAGTDNTVVNVAIAITPEEVLSVDDLSGVIAENAKLKNQNKWLRKEYTSLRETREREFERSCEAATNSMGQIGTLRDQNAKLRELVRDLYNRLNDIDENCGECRSSCDYDAWNFGDPKCVYARRVRELGIEVE